MSQLYNEFTATWIVKNYSFFRIRYRCDITSPIFTAENLNKTEWQICIVSDESESYVSLQLYKCDFSEPVTINFLMELCNLENEVFYTTYQKSGMKFGYRNRYTFARVFWIEELEKKIRETSSDTLILRCRIGMTLESDTVVHPLIRSCTFQTTQCLDELSYIRSVHNMGRNPPWSYIQKFQIKEEEQLNVDIKVLQEDILFEITQVEKVSKQKIRCEIALLNYIGTEKVSSCGFFAFSENSRVWRFPSFLKASLFGSSSSITLKFSFTISSGTGIETKCINELKNRSLSPSVEDLKNTPVTDPLREDLRKILFDKERADVSFRIGEEVISAHKLILVSRSPVFSSMFNQQMAENETGVINITDMDAQTLKLFLEFVYTGELEELDWERMLELLLAAEKYQIPSLKERCSQFLEHDFNIENVCEVVSVADMVSAQGLKAAAMDYIKENVAKVLSSSKWSILADKNVKLCSEIICHFSEKVQAKNMKN